MLDPGAEVLSTRADTAGHGEWRLFVSKHQMSNTTLSIAALLHLERYMIVDHVGPSWPMAIIKG